MPLAKSNIARSLWAVKQALFPSFEEKRYHLQFRHATLIGLTLMCASFTMPAYHQTMPFADSLFNTSPDIPVEAGYNKIQRFLGGVMHWNIAIAVWMALNIIIEAIVQRSAPVWYEIIWMLLVVAGQGVSLGLIASSRPVNICDRSYPIVPIPDVNGGFVPSNSALAICSNWRGMTGLLAAIICVFMIHVTWHVIVTVRHRALRQTVWVLPITDYRWNLPAQLQRVNTVFPGDVEKALPADSKDEKQTESQFSSGDYTSKGSHPDTLSFPGSVSINEEYSNYSRPSNASKLQALPANSKPVILQQSIITRSDTESIIESDRASSPQSPKEPAPFSYSNRI